MKTSAAEQGCGDCTDVIMSCPSASMSQTPHVSWTTGDLAGLAANNLMTSRSITMPAAIAMTKTNAGRSKKPALKDAWARADAGEAPANAKDETAGDERRIDLAYGRQPQFVAEKRPAASMRDGKGHEPHGHRASHDEGQRRVPMARDVEKAMNLARLVHARKIQPPAEDQASHK
jgi:hypothetical protein